jgi:hypothetical protein
VGTETTRAAVRITSKPGPPPWTDWRSFSSGIITGRVNGLWIRVSMAVAALGPILCGLRDTESAAVGIGRLTIASGGSQLARAICSLCPGRPCNGCGDNGIDSSSASSKPMIDVPPSTANLAKSRAVSLF